MLSISLKQYSYLVGAAVGSLSRFRSGNGHGRLAEADDAPIVPTTSLNLLERIDHVDLSGTRETIETSATVEMTGTSETVEMMVPSSPGYPWSAKLFVLLAEPSSVSTL